MNSDMRAQADGPALDWSGTGRRAVEAGITLGWREYVGDAGASVGLERFHASADYHELYAEFGITAERAAAAALASLGRLTGRADAAQQTSHEGRSD